MAQSRLELLRALLRQNNFSAYIVTSADSHNSEYVASAHARRSYISGFTGSAGTAVVTQDKALLWTDGRYYTQALQELQPPWELMKDGFPATPTIQDYLAEAKMGSSVGVNADTFTTATWATYAKKITLVPSQVDLVDVVWASDTVSPKPSEPSSTVNFLEEKYSGESTSSKLERMAKEVKSSSCDLIVLSALDDIAWLYNLRGSDVSYNPVFFSHCILHADGSSVLFVNDSRFTAEAKASLPPTVTINPYDKFHDWMKANTKGKIVGYDELQISQGVLVTLKESQAEPKVVPSPIKKAKSRKNPIEIKGFQDCHIEDGVALVRYLSWLERELQAGSVLNECQGADKLRSLRALSPNFVDLSFSTISSAGPNAAVIHYSPEPKTARVINKNEIYLVDSGGQYKTGTTDVTRTVHYGVPTPEEVEAYTLVLKGHIALDTAVFPTGTTGHAIDVLARQHLWKYGLQYNHGTGHGVGHYLCVHEGPMGIGMRPTPTGASIEINNVISNEPGFYQAGKFGIRIENLVRVVEKQTKYRFNDVPYLGFQAITMAPLCRKLIDVTLLEPHERQWVNGYHASVVGALLPKLKSVDEAAAHWLENETQTL